MNLKTNILSAILIISATLASCSKEGKGGEYAESTYEITFAPTLSAEAVPSKAGLYDSGNIIDEEHHGNFSVIAYKSGTKTRHFLDPERVYYMYYQDAPEESRWRFYDNSDFYSRYWPQTYALDFIAYMPWDLAGCPASFSKEEQTFSCTLPLDKSGQDSAQELIIAYNTGEKYTEAGKGKVSLDFRHPFTAVSFMLGEAHGNTEIHKVGLTGMFYSGTYDIPGGEWSNSETGGDLKGNMDIAISKTVGTAGDSGIQLNSLIGGPYLVIPQQTDGIKISISFTWNSTRKDAEVSIGNGTWQPGFIYTYKLNLGDNDEDILADVIVEEWNAVKHKHEIEVE